MLKDFLNDKGKLGELWEKQLGEYKIYRLAPISITETSRAKRIDIGNCVNAILKLPKKTNNSSKKLNLHNLLKKPINQLETLTLNDLDLRYLFWFCTRKKLSS